MARPTSTALSNGAGFSPEIRQAPKLDVAASLNVHTGPSGAESLARALGMITEVVNPIMEDKLRKKTQKSVATGSADATLNQVDAKREAEDDAYAMGAKLALKERAVRDAIAEVDREIAQDGADLSPMERAKRRDDLLRERIGDIAADPESARIAAKLVAPWQNRNYAEDNNEVIKEAEIRTVEAAGQNVKDQMQDGTFKYEAAVAQLAPVVGRERAAEIIIENVGAAAVNLRDETLLDKVLPETIKTADGQVIDGPRMSQKHRPLLDKFKDEAKRARLEDMEQVRREGKSVFEKKWIKDPTLFTSKDYDFHIAQKESLFSADELNSYLRAAQAELDRRKSAVAVGDIRLGNPNVRLRWLEGTLKSDGKPVTQSDLQEQMNRDVEQSVRGTGRPVEDVASEFSEREGYVYQPIANDLQKVPPSDTKLWGSAVDVYFKLRPSVRSLYVPSEDQRALFERTQALRGAGKKDADIAEILANTDQRIVTSNRQALAEKWNKKRETIDNQEVNDGGWFGGSIKVSNLANAGMIRSEIRRRAELRIDVGTDADSALASATKEVMDTHVFLPGPSGRAQLMPRTPDMGGDFGHTIEWFYKQLPAFLKSRGITADPKKVRLSTVPGSDQNTVLTLVDADGFPVDPKLMWTPRALEAERDRLSRSDAFKAAQKEQKATMVGEGFNARSAAALGSMIN